MNTCCVAAIACEAAAAIAGPAPRVCPKLYVMEEVTGGTT